ncbi:hypothetical protein L210DRAFT_3687771 [Boletus edulis BED1]|uniref:Uncharacterized protein n=1 Tax=Boletus edulis BED1 TaxID=1328754 RepID=A0AAD4GLJ9_BOLED|nr:hypothetical protein L210DRAFT_3687771 [Boletus edulis BED1]
MPNPSVGSANPSTSLSALWGYILPVLNHIIHSPTNSTNKAPTIEPPYHIGIHTATYNYFTAQSKAANAHANSRADKGPSTVRSATRADLYEQLDKYFMDLAWELLLGTPEDDMALIQHYVKCTIDEDKGWLTLSDIFNVKEGNAWKAMSLKERRVEELKKWGYEEGGLAETLALAEQRAEAVSTLNCIVPLAALALRRFRTEFIEPLLAALKVKEKKGTPGAASVGDNVQELLGVQDISPEECLGLARDLTVTLCAISVRNGHPL